jgi:SAM-dependent methyltransferase
MGINSCEAQAILALKRQGAVGSAMLCLGRPELFVSAQQAARFARDFGFAGAEAAAVAARRETFAEPFLKAFGFDTVRSLDASAYEGASIIHDLNTPIPASLEATTEFLYDGGTMEHVFDVATVFKNIARLLKVGGTVLISTAANGQCGHGFYQYSPELFYRVLEANGFEDVRVYLVGLQPPERWVLAVDPKIAKRRVQFLTSEPTQLITIARKARNMDSFVVPQQSDYAEGVWRLDQDAVAAAHGEWSSAQSRFRAFARDRLAYPAAVAMRAAGASRIPGLWRRELFRPVDPVRDEL